MNKKGLTLVFIVIFFLNGFIGFSQTNQERQPLLSILQLLSERYNISFSYIDETVVNIEAVVPKDTLSLTEAIQQLALETELKFEILNERFIAITSSKEGENDKPIIREQLDEVFVTNYLTTGITKFNDGSINLKPAKFGILPGLIEPDVLQAIQALPGVLSIDESVSNINIRGGTHDQNLILWDGIKMYQSGHFFGLISAFNPYTTQQVNVAKNGTRAKYGDGISSVIDMQLSNTIDNTFTAGAGFNLINAHGYAKIPISHNTELQISSRRSITDLIVTPTYDQYFKRVFQDSDLSNTQKNDNTISQNEDFSFYDITAKLLYDLSKKDKIRLHFLNVNNSLNYQEQSTINDRSEALNSSLSQENFAYGFTYTRDWTTDLSTTAQIYVSNYDLDATNFDIINNQRLIQENEVYDGSGRLDINYRLNTNFKLNGGYQFSEVGISNLEDVNNPDFRSFIKEVIRSHSGYGEVSFLSNDAKTKLNFGTRVNYFNKFEEVLIEPRLNLSQRFLGAFRLELLGEFKSQTTTQIIDLQNDFLGIEKRRWVLSNNNKEVTINNGKVIYPVPIVKSKQASAGIHFNKNKLLISAEAFIKKVDGITTRSQGFQNQFQFVNAVGGYDIKGVDVLINKQFQDVVSAWLGYSYSKNDYTFPTLNDGQAFPNNADIRHALSFAGTFSYKDLKLALGLNWHSGRPTTLPDANDDPNQVGITYTAPNSANLDDYMRVDFSATYTFNIFEKSKAIVGASLWNLFNRQNILNTYYTLDDENVINKIENQSLGITPNVSFRVVF